MAYQYWPLESSQKLKKFLFVITFFQPLPQLRPEQNLQHVRMMLAHRQKFLTEQISKELLTEWKNIEKQKCMSLAAASRDPEELTRVPLASSSHVPSPKSEEAGPFVLL